MSAFPTAFLSFFAQYLSHMLKYLPFGLIGQCLRYKVSLLPTASLPGAQRKAWIHTIRQKHQYVSEAYILSKFSNYSYVVYVEKNNATQGLMFIHSFEQDKTSYLYVGPIFFVSKLALGLCVAWLIELRAKKNFSLHLCAEVQNPEIIMYWHTVMPAARTFPQAMTFHITKAAIKTMAVFAKHVPQLDCLSLQQFCSRGYQSLFKATQSTIPLVHWLKKNGIDLAQGDSLVMLTILLKEDLPSLRQKIWYCFFTYPAHRKKYLLLLSSLTTKN